MHNRIAAVLVWVGLIPLPGIGANLDEVVVTAERLSRPIARSTGSITAIDPVLLDSGAVVGITDLSTHVPNLDIKQSFGNQNPVLTMRGVGLNDFNANNNPSTGVYVDGGYLPSPYLLGMRWFDLERAEVLHGPQGTAFGRNTTAGAISLTARRPDENSSKMLRFGAASFDALSFESVLNGPLGEQTQARLAITGDRGFSGPFRNQRGSKQGDVNRLAVRGGLSRDVTPEFSIYAQLHGGYDRSHGWHYTHQGSANADGTDFCVPALAGAADLSTCFGPLGYQDIDGDPFTGDWSQPHRMDNRFAGARFEANWALDDYTIKSTTAYEGFSRRNTEDADVSPAAILDVAYRNRFDVYSQEIVVSGAGDGFEWNTGVYASRDVIEAKPNLLIVSDDYLGTHLRVQWRQTTESAAAFGHGRWQLGSKFALLAGVRASWESREFVGSTTDLNPFGSSLLLSPGQTGPVVLADTDKRISDTSLSGRLALEVTPTPRDLLYVSLANGQKSGGFTGSFAFSNEELAPFDQEHVLAWEAGWKHRTANGALALDVAAFHYDYKDLQLFTTVQRTGAAVFLLTNAADARVTGAELKARWQPTAWMNLQLGGAWLDAQVRDFEGTPDVTGNTLPNAPRLVLLPAIELNSTFGEWHAGLGLQGEYRSRTYNEIGNLAYLQQSGFSLWHARASLERTLPTGRQLELAVWSRNLTDKRYFQEGFDQGTFFVNLRMLGAPRTSGFTVTLRLD